jgi:hypothetical protein
MYLAYLRTHVTVWQLKPEIALAYHLSTVAKLMGKSILLYVMPTLAPQAPLAKLASTILH